MGLASIIEAGRGCIGMAEPFVNFGNVGFMAERIRRGGSAPFRSCRAFLFFCRWRIDFSFE